MNGSLINIIIHIFGTYFSAARFYRFAGQILEIPRSQQKAQLAGQNIEPANQNIEPTDKNIGLAEK